MLEPEFLFIRDAGGHFPRKGGRTAVGGYEKGKEEEYRGGAGDVSPWWVLHPSWPFSTCTAIETSWGEVGRNSLGKARMALSEEAQVKILYNVTKC